MASSWDEQGRADQNGGNGGDARTGGVLIAETGNGAPAPVAAQAGRVGMRFQRHYTTPGQHPFDAVEWSLRTAAITSDKGEVLFEQKDVEVPSSWSMTATQVVASKYFHGGLGDADRERSVQQLITRVVDQFAGWGRAQNYFADAASADAFEAELTYLLVNQLACFNSPVWFNAGVEKRPQCSACFINSVEDTMESILELARTEGMLFKFGSGTGTNLSPIRASRETLGGGGGAAGPVRFMRGYDAFAGVIKSGGKTRRAAKMQILDVDHPDVMDFIYAKQNEEKKAWALIDRGYDGSFGGEAYNSVFFQNANFSVRVTDEFMRAVLDDRTFPTRARKDGRVVEEIKAREVLQAIAQGTHICGDPGMQYDTIINDWHTCPNTDKIYASNPCSEYMFLDNSACNLASLNLMKFRRDDGSFDTVGFRHAVDVLATAMEIIVSNASYPTDRIGRNSERFRPLGLGYANLGALLMSKGLPYDSDEGRTLAATITALMHGQAYLTSAKLARAVGPFAGYHENREPMLRVIDKHRAHVRFINPTLVDKDLLSETMDVYDAAYELGEQHGYRNSQVTVLAPTGTIGFMMDCDTTGVEPDIALVKWKKLADGGIIKIVNNTVPMALGNLGYDEEQSKAIIAWIDEQGTIEGAPGLKDGHLPVFDCAFKPANGKRSIHYMGHLRMMAAVQPFLSGAISKTVNLPEEATVEEIAETYLEGWKLGLKAVAIYRDNSKRTQPLNTSSRSAPRRLVAAKGKGGGAGDQPFDEAAGSFPDVAQALIPAKAQRRRLPDEREALTHKFSIAGHEGYLTVGMYEDGSPGELFITMSKEGSMISGLVDSVATITSICLQYGVPVDALARKFSHTRFEPAGFTPNPQIPIAKSIVDYVFRYLGIKFNGGAPDAPRDLMDDPENQ